MVAAVLGMRVFLYGWEKKHKRRYGATTQSVRRNLSWVKKNKLLRCSPSSLCHILSKSIRGHISKRARRPIQVWILPMQHRNLLYHSLFSFSRPSLMREKGFCISLTVTHLRRAVPASTTISTMARYQDLYFQLISSVLFILASPVSR